MYGSRNIIKKAPQCGAFLIFCDRLQAGRRLAASTTIIVKSAFADKNIVTT